MGSLQVSLMVPMEVPTQKNVRAPKLQPRGVKLRFSGSGW